MRLLLNISLVSVLLAAGCRTGTRQQAVATAVPGNKVAATRSVDFEDYSPKAVERRTEAQARFATAFLYELGEQPEPAAEEYLKAALADLRNEGLVTEAATRLLRLKQSDQALDLLKKAAAEPGASGMLFAQLGLAYALSGHKEEAIEANRTAIRKMPQALIGYRHLAQIYFQNGQPEEGLKALDAAAKQPGTDAAFLTELGEFYIAFSKSGPNDTAKARAREVFLRAAKENPKHPVILQKLADGFAYLGESDQAVTLYLKLLERYPHLPGLREKLADLYLRQQDRTHAAEQLQAIIQSNPTSPQAYYFLGSLAYEDKKMPEAVDNFRKVILLDENFEPAYYDLAGALINLNKPNDALEALAKARAKFKPSFVCEFYTGLAHSRLKQYANAIKFFTAAEIVAVATDTNRLNHLFYFQLGAAYERNQQFEEAEKNFKKSLQLSPEFSEALNYLGYMWAERGENLDAARRMIEKAVQLEPKNAAFLDSLGWVLYKLNRPAEALPHLLKAIEYAEEPDSTLQDHLGDVYGALNQPDKAREAWRKSLAIDPNENKQSIQKKLDTLSQPSSSVPSSAPK